jgi:hypothetical protein
MAKADYYVGQTLYFYRITYRRGDVVAPVPVVVSKIGRKWVSISRNGHDAGRFDPESGYVDGGQFSSPGRVWRSAAEHDAEAERVRVWDLLKSAIRSHIGGPRPDVTTDDIRAAAKALKIELSDV